jgi:pimeloyl-ACP methyl ester carboxylesterase
MSSGTAAQSWSLSEIFHFEGQQVRYGVLGSGEPLVLLHGTPFSSSVVPDAGHRVQEDAPETLVAAQLGFLS